jgi:hypothetical protein
MSPAQFDGSAWGRLIEPGIKRGLALYSSEVCTSHPPHTRCGNAEMRRAMRMPRFRMCGKIGPLIALSPGA